MCVYTAPLRHVQAPEFVARAEAVVRALARGTTNRILGRQQAAGSLLEASGSSGQLLAAVRVAHTALQAALSGGLQQQAPLSARQLVQSVLPHACQLATALQAYWQRPEQQVGDRLAVARAAAARSCAYLRCANLAGVGSPAAGQGGGSLRCSGCKAVWYCGTVCSHADWRQGGHRRVCAALAAERQAARQQRQVT